MIRKWFSGVFRPDRLETDSVHTEQASINGPLDAESATVTTLNGGGVLSEGDGTERQHWVVAAGADDPTGADPEDIIFEEES